jgi:hypothetical protein
MRMRPLNSFLSLLGLALFGFLAGGCVLAAEAELPDVEVMNHGIAIPAAPPEADSDVVSLSVTFKQKPNRVGLAKDAFRDVKILAVQLATTSGLNDLGFVHALRITATTKEAEAAGKKPVVIAQYTRGTKTSTGPSLEIPTDPPADITELWRANEVAFTLDATGVLPTVPWTADVGMRVGATLVY